MEGSSGRGGGLQRHRVAQGLQAAHQPPLDGQLVPLVETLAAQIVIGRLLSGEERRDDHQDAVRHRHCRTLGSSASRQPLIVGREVGVFGAGRRLGGFDEGGAQPRTAFAGAALVAYIAYRARIAGHVKRVQKKRVRESERRREERARKGKPLPIEPDLSRGLGARLDALHRAEKRDQLMHTALGVFTSAGVVRLRLPREGDVSTVGDLLTYSLDELEDVAAEKGGIRHLLDEKWRKLYKATAPRGLFERGEMWAA